MLASVPGDEARPVYPGQAYRSFCPLSDGLASQCLWSMTDALMCPAPAQPLAAMIKQGRVRPLLCGGPAAGGPYPTMNEVGQPLSLPQHWGHLANSLGTPLASSPVPPFRGFLYVFSSAF